MTSLPPAAIRFTTAARQAGIDPDIMVMEQSTRTADEAAIACAADVAQIVKSLVFQGASSRKPILILVSGKNRVDEEAVANALGEGLARMDGRAVRDLTGYAIGGIPPLGHDTKLKTWMDEDLLGHERVYAAAGTPNTMFAVDPKALCEATSATVIQVTRATAS